MADDIPTRPEAEQEVLFLSPFFAPEPISTGKYNAYLARGLVASGLHVRAICSHPLYPDWVVKPTDHQEPGMTIERGSAQARYPTSTIGRRLVLELRYAWHVWRTLRKQPTRAQTVVMVFPPVLFALPLRLLLRRRRLIGVVHDLYGIMANSTNSWKRRLVARLIGTVEKAILHRCDRLIALSTSMKQALEQHYGVPGERIDVAYPFETLGDVPRTQFELAERMPDEMHHVVYSGALGEKQMPQLLVSVFRALLEMRQDVVCHVLSAGPAFEALRKQETAQPRLQVRSLVPEHQLWELYERSAVQVIPQAPGTGAGAFPSKLPNLVAAGVPVFAICDEHSELATVLQAADAGCPVTGQDPQGLAEALSRYLDAASAEPREARRARLEPYVERYFRVSGLLDGLALGRPQSERVTPE